MHHCLSVFYLVKFKTNVEVTVFSIDRRTGRLPALRLLLKALA